jgi:hypothetical protein
MRCLSVAVSAACPSTDDPLSAVDPKLAASIFQRALLEFLAHKTRVLATHSTQFAAEADLCLMLDGKGVAQQVTNILHCVLGGYMGACRPSCNSDTSLRLENTCLCCPALSQGMSEL